MSRFAFIALILIGLPLSAEDEKWAATSLAEVDQDYAFQGEYAARGWGLQVVARGEGKFSALLLPGGLPGSGWNKSTPDKLSGALDGGFVLLRGERVQVDLHPSYADIRDANGRFFARLHKQVRQSRSLGLRPPASARVLFDGRQTEHFQNARITPDGHLQMGAITKDAVGDFRLHLEFMLPYMPHASGQGRANSGVYIQQRYEVQILDSFGLAGVANECGALYKQKAPDTNMALPPLSWQTYDIWFRQPRWSPDGKTKVKPAEITVLHNGVPVQWRYPIPNKTGAGKPEGPEELPIVLQDHGNPVVFRNIWLVPGGGEYGAPVSRSVVAKSSSAPRRSECFVHRWRWRR